MRLCNVYSDRYIRARLTESILLPCVTAVHACQVRTQMICFVTTAVYLWLWLVLCVHDLTAAAFSQWLLRMFVFLTGHNSLLPSVIGKRVMLSSDHFSKGGYWFSVLGRHLMSFCHGLPPNRIPLHVSCLFRIERIICEDLHVWAGTQQNLILRYLLNGRDHKAWILKVVWYQGLTSMISENFCVVKEFKSISSKHLYSSETRPASMSSEDIIVMRRARRIKITRLSTEQFPHSGGLARRDCVYTWTRTQILTVTSFSGRTCWCRWFGGCWRGLVLDTRRMCCWSFLPQKSLWFLWRMAGAISAWAIDVLHTVGRTVSSVQSLCLILWDG